MSVANMTIKTKTSTISNGVVDLHTSLQTGDGNGTKNGSAGDGSGMYQQGGMGNMMGMGDMSGMGMDDIRMENTPDMALNGAFDSLSIFRRHAKANRWNDVF